ncbi:MAG TPA: DUF1579 family protein [Chitinophagaceae bacterium]|nr:DUF1579 family protein [Chitinophagaceae bacterium]
MKRIFLTVAAAFSLSFVFSQTADLAKMIGEWDIEATFQARPGAELQSFSGKAVWQPVYNGKYVHENFEFEFRGSKVIGEAFLGESKRLNSLEFVQVDNANPAMFTLTGNWNDSLKTLELNSLPGGISLKWNYIFLEDGSFIKRMLIPQPDGSFHLQSQYHYKKKK